MVREERHRTARARRFNGRYPVVRRQADRSHTSPRLVRRTLPAPRPRLSHPRNPPPGRHADAEAGCRWCACAWSLGASTASPSSENRASAGLWYDEAHAAGYQGTEGRRPDRQHRGASKCATVFTLKVHMRRRTFISSSAAAAGVALSAHGADNRKPKKSALPHPALGHHDPDVHLAMLKKYDKYDTILMPLNPADPSYLSFEKLVLPVAVERGMGIQGMKSTANSRLLHAIPLKDCLTYV